MICGHHPYLELSDYVAVNAIMDGVRPKKPEDIKRLGCTYELWTTVEQCWLEDRDARPNVDDILFCLKNAMTFWYMKDR